MTRVDNIQESFRKVSSMVFENLPEDIAVFQCVYIRDRWARDNNWDWEISFAAISKWLVMYDLKSAHEFIEREMRNLEDA
jgi:hypothetical protein